MTTRLSELSLREQETDKDWLERALSAVATTTIVVIGDFCLDAYWELSAGPEETSLETGLPVQHVRTQRYSPGGAGNVAANVAALGVRAVRAVGLVGRDLFGTELRASLHRHGVSTDGLLEGPPAWATPCYAKPLRDGGELSRFDFGGANQLSPDDLVPLIRAFDAALEDAHGVVVNQQLANSVIGPDFIAAINERIQLHPHVSFVVDARNRAQDFRGAILKLNGCEAARLAGLKRSVEARPVRISDDLARYAETIHAMTSQPVFITSGERGIVLATAEGLHSIPGIEACGPVDPVGAGDTVAAALTAALAGGVAPTFAARFANLAAAITVKKLRTTGTASPAELRHLGPQPDYLYEPALADNSRAARFLPGTRIELIRECLGTRAIRHVIFDHDGTLSTLREGWEDVMEPMMIEAIIGAQRDQLTPQERHKIQSEVRAHIDRTTGRQTLSQMTGLIELVRAHGRVPEDEVLDEHGYKAIYHQHLMVTVRQRIGQIQRGERPVDDFEIPGARAFLRALSDAGLILHLASGTDVADVRSEARVMGYAGYFGDRIYGARGQLNHDVKREVVARICESENVNGDSLMVVGDGPVEMREGRMRGAFCLGVASDEVRRHGLNLTKRRRLIRAGADAVIADFTRLGELRSFLGLKQ